MEYDGGVDGLSSVEVVNGYPKGVAAGFDSGHFDGHIEVSQLPDILCDIFKTCYIGITSWRFARIFQYGDTWG